MKLFILFTAFFYSQSSCPNEGLFSGRISKISEETGLVRVKVDFSNFRYLNKKDKVSFWDKGSNLEKCDGFIIGKTNEYLLLRIPNYNLCHNKAYMREGAFISFFSQDLINNLKMGRELMAILKKKRMAYLSKVKRGKKELASYMEKVDAVNDRYTVLRKKLEMEWKRELSSLEEDNVESVRKHKRAVLKLEEIEFKMEKYKVEEESLKLDRWALDSRLYFRK